jgi:hypothetical protein
VKDTHFLKSILQQLHHVSNLVRKWFRCTGGFPTGDDYLALLFMLFGLIPPTTLSYLAFKSFDFERTW